MTIAALHTDHFHELETPRLHLRPLTIEDAKDMFAYTSIPDNFRFLKRESHQSVEEDRAFLQNVLEGYCQHREFIWGITTQTESGIIGTCRLFNLRLEEQSCEVSYMVHPAQQGQGIASEAVGRLIEYAFQDLEFSTVFACCAVANVGSEQVMRKCGMRQVQVLPHHANLHGIWQDFLLYSIEKKVTL